MPHKECQNIRYYRHSGTNEMGKHNCRSYACSYRLSRPAAIIGTGPITDRI